MQAPVPRRIVVDDTDPGFVYSSTFFVDSTLASQGGTENFGPIFGSTLHGTRSNGSFQYTFSGTQIYVYGSTSGDAKDPNWGCFIDEISIGPTPPSQFAENNWLLCFHQNLVDGVHNLTVTATSNGHLFLFDYLQYTPSATVSLDNALVRVDYTDPSISYSSAWVANTDKTSTIIPGAQAIISFVGTELEWYSSIPAGASRNSYHATYSVDHGSATPFVLPTLPPSSTNITQHNQLIFKTQKLSPGPHTINVTFASGSSAPLELDYLLIQNATQPINDNSTSRTGSSVPTAMSTPNSSEDISTKKSNAGSIAGGLLGSVLFVLSVIAAYLFYQHYKRTRQSNSSKFREIIPIPFVPQPRPVNPSPASREPITATHTSRDISGSRHSQVNPLSPSHRRRQSHGQKNHAPRASAGPSQGLVSEQNDESADESTPYHGGYQTWGQAKAMEAKAHRHTRQRDSYI